MEEIQKADCMWIALNVQGAEMEPIRTSAVLAGAIKKAVKVGALLANLLKV